MPLKDILLQLDSYPEPTPPGAIEQAVSFTAGVGGTISALAVEIDIRVRTNPIAEHLIGLSRLAKDEEQKSRDACAAVLEVFSEKARAAGVLGQALHGRADLYDVGDYVAGRARTRDLCLVPVLGPADGQRVVAEAVIFGSGRPVLLFRPATAALPAGAPGVVVLAWDGGRTAARAMADALPVLQAARDVRVVTVVNEKPDARPGLAAETVRHLRAHGVAAVGDEIDAGGRPIGAVLDDHAAGCGADLLVMGAYGRSRAREFILGGATEHMLRASIAPLLLSH